MREFICGVNESTSKLLVLLLIYYYGVITVCIWRLGISCLRGSVSDTLIGTSILVVSKGIRG
jgi:hypothetical protein